MNTPATFYLHGSKEDSSEAFTDAVPSASEEAQGEARHTGYETVFDGYWTDEGHYMATKVNGVNLESPVRL